MKKVLIIGKAPKEELEISKYKVLNTMCDDYGFEVISSPLDTGDTMSFGEYAELFSNIENADIIIADVSEESTEQGMQLKEADVLGKPIIAIANVTNEMPQVIESLPTIAEVISYDNIEDVREGILRNFAVLE